MAMVEVLKEVALPPPAAFKLFTKAFFQWWPHAYSLSGDLLEDLIIGGKTGELCSEIGPSGFRIDFGRVLEWSPPTSLTLSWQVSPDSRPEPDPAKASRVHVEFVPVGGATEVRLTHDQFANHGEGGEAYASEMASDLGWPYIMELFREFASRPQAG
jgi:uncharacterized protein YndB with AHSA1/START domain